MSKEKPFSKVVKSRQNHEESNKTIEAYRNMGLGKLISPNVSFMRSFRWLLFSTRLPYWFNKSIKIDYVNKTLTITFIDVIDSNDVTITGMHGYYWADQLANYPDEILTFITLDGCGVELSQTNFSGLTVLEHETNTYDYSISDVATRKIVLSFTDQKTCLLPKQQLPTRAAIYKKKKRKSPRAK